MGCFTVNSPEYIGGFVANHAYFPIMNDILILKEDFLLFLQSAH